MATAQTVAVGRVVTMHYKLSLDDGRVVDSSEAGEPLSYWHGSGHIVPGLEAALEGQAMGAELKVTVSPDEGYGVRRPDAVKPVRRSAFPDDAQFEVGMTFEAMDENQDPILGTITEMEGDQVTVDFNHPMAGLNLNFEVTITEVREATAEERSHGHIHGQNGHEP